MLALGEMVSQRFLVPLYEVRVLEGQPRSFGVAVNTSACHAEDHGFDSRHYLQTVNRFKAGVVQ